MRDPKLQINVTFTVATVAEADQLYKAVKAKLAGMTNVIITAAIIGEPIEP